MAVTDLVAASAGRVLVGIVGFIIWVLIIAWTSTIAARKGRHAFGWGVLAFFFSWIALIVVALLPSKTRNAV